MNAHASVKHQLRFTMNTDQKEYFDMIQDLRFKIKNFIFLIVLPTHTGVRLGRRASVCLIFCFIVSLSNLSQDPEFGFSISAYAIEDTLRPSQDQPYVEWEDYPAAGDSDYVEIDDISPDEDTTYLYTSNTDRHQTWKHSDFNTSNIIDSVRLVIRARSKATAGTPQVIFGRRWNDGEFWHTCTYGEGTDTVNLGSSWTNYGITWSVEPCGNSAWTTTNLNGTDYAWWFYSEALGEKTDTVLQDNFNDNSLDTDKWVERDKGGGSDAAEQNQRMELNLNHTAHTGAGIFSKSKYKRQASYVLTVKFQTNWDTDRSANQYGYDGIWVIPGDTTNVFDSYYGVPTKGVFFRLGGGCGFDNDGVGIYADDDGGWECSWDTTICNDATDLIDTSSVNWYTVKITFNGSNGACSLFTQDTLRCSGYLGSNWFSMLGDSIRFDLHTSYYNTSVKWDRYDDFVLAERQAPDNRVTQSFIVVYSHAAAAKKQGGLVQDEDKRGIAEGGIAR